MYKVFEKSKTVNVLLGSVSEEEKKIIAEYRDIAGYNIKMVDEMSSPVRLNRPRIDSDIVKEGLSKELLKEFNDQKKVQATDEKGKPKFRKDKDGRITDKPQTIGFMGALCWLKKNHKSEYDKLVAIAEEKYT